MENFGSTMSSLTSGGFGVSLEESRIIYLPSLLIEVSNAFDFDQIPLFLSKIGEKIEVWK
jgi:hypothetical protein